MKLPLFLSLFALSLGGVNGFAQAPAPNPEDDEPTIVRAYPNWVRNPDQGGDFTVEIGQEISLDVRGLGTWTQKLSQKQTDSDSIKKVISPCLDTNGNVRVSNTEWIQQVANASMNLCLYIDGRPFNDVQPFKADPHYADTARDTTGCPLITVRFRVKPGYFGANAPDKSSPASKEWDELITALYSRMNWFKAPTTDLTIGLPGQNGIASLHLTSALNPGTEDNEPHGTTIRIRPYSSILMGSSVLILGLGTTMGLWLAISSDLLRDTSAVPNPGGRFPFSLGRCQMAVWTYVVLGSYLFIWLSTDDYNRLEIQAVGLIGISVATGLGAFAVNRMSPTGSAGSTLSPGELAISSIKVLDPIIANEQALFYTLPAGSPAIAQHEARLQELQQRKQYLKIPLTRFLTDILTEINSISFHRFQLFLWTITLAFIFIRSVYMNLQMPVFDSTILILMGISGGTYIGFKWPTQ